MINAIEFMSELKKAEALLEEVVAIQDKLEEKDMAQAAKAA